MASAGKAFHFVPFTKTQRYALLGGFHFRLTVADIEFPEVDALVARSNGDVVAATDMSRSSHSVFTASSMTFV